MSQSWGESSGQGAVNPASCCKELRQTRAEKRAIDLVAGMSPVIFANQKLYVGYLGQGTVSLKKKVR